jgi:hypothetical protein
MSRCCDSTNVVLNLVWGMAVVSPFLKFAKLLKYQIAGIPCVEAPVLYIIYSEIPQLLRRCLGVSGDVFC